MVPAGPSDLEPKLNAVPDELRQEFERDPWQQESGMQQTQPTRPHGQEGVASGSRSDPET